MAAARLIRLISPTMSYHRILFSIVRALGALRSEERFNPFSADEFANHYDRHYAAGLEVNVDL